jgi:hypothetical protein
VVLLLLLLVGCAARPLRQTSAQTYTARDTVWESVSGRGLALLTDTTKTRYRLSVVDRFHRDTITEREVVLLGAEDRYLSGVRVVDLVSLLRSGAEVSCSGETTAEEPQPTPSPAERLTYDVGRIAIGIAFAALVVLVLGLLGRLRRPFH